MYTHMCEKQATTDFLKEEKEKKKSIHMVHNFLVKHVLYLPLPGS